MSHNKLREHELPLPESELRKLGVPDKHIELRKLGFCLPMSSLPPAARAALMERMREDIEEYTDSEDEDNSFITKSSTQPYSESSLSELSESSLSEPTNTTAESPIPQPNLVCESSLSESDNTTAELTIPHSNSVSNLFETKIREQISSFETSTKNGKYKLVETVSPSHNHKLEQAIQRIVSLEQRQEETLRLHHATVGLMTNLINLLSPATSLQSPPLTPASPGKDSCRLETTSPSTPSYLPSGQPTFLHTKHNPSEDTQRKEQLHLLTKEGTRQPHSCFTAVPNSGYYTDPHCDETRAKTAAVIPSHSYFTAVPNSRYHTCRRNLLAGGMNNQTGDTERQQQQQHIKQLASCIDEIAAHYNQGRTTTTPEPYPKVNWARLKPHSRKSLPQPIQLPLSSCPQDSNLYPDFPNPQGRIMEWHKPTTQCFLPGCQHTECLPPADSTSTTVLSNSSPNTYNVVSRNKEGQILLNKAYRPTTQASSPFGTTAGFETNLGTVAPPKYPIDGYIYTQQGWKLHATPGQQILPATQPSRSRAKQSNESRL